MPPTSTDPVGRLPLALVRLAVALLPRSQRGRRREEWSADVAGAPELGASATGVAVGALVGAVGIVMSGAIIASAGGPVPVTSPPSVGRAPAAVLGAVLGAGAGVVLAVAAVLLAGGLFADERQQEGTLVVALGVAAVLGAALGRRGALRLTGHAPTWAVLPLGLALLATVGAFSLLGHLAPPSVLNAYGVLLLPASCLSVLAVVIAAGELLATRRRPA